MKHVFYRYMASHGFETLRNCWFMVSKPSKFRKEGWSPMAPTDDAECMPQLGGDGQSVFPLLDRLGIPKERYKQLFNNIFASPETLDQIIRILCLSDPERNLKTDMYMWKHYAANFAGLRIGIELDVENGVCNMLKRFRGEYVRYEFKHNEIQPEQITTNEDISECCFNILYKKARSSEGQKGYEIESEFRLIVDERFWKTSGDQCFLPLDNGMIVSVDVGCKMAKRDVEKLYAHCIKNFALRRFAKASPIGEVVAYCDLAAKSQSQGQGIVVEDHHH